MNAYSFIFGIILISAVAFVVTTWIRVANGYPLTDRNGKPVERVGELESARELQMLAGENASLKQQISLLEERIAVIERIVTDPGERTAREIEQLR